MIKNFFALTFFLLGFSNISRADDVSRIDEAAVKAAKDSKPIWVYQASSHKECEDAENDRADVETARITLENANIRVLAFERNIIKPSTAPVIGSKKCGDLGSFVACALVFSKDQLAAEKLGFKVGGNCGQSYKIKNN